jgi:hypothetical protein
MESNKEKAIESIEVNEPILVVKQNCVPGQVCEPKDYFEMITECALCGKLC